MAMNYANLGFAQIDFTGVNFDGEGEQQLLAGTYAKTVEAIKNNKMLVVVNLVSIDEGVTYPFSPMSVCGYVSNDNSIYLETPFPSTLVISPTDKFTVIGN